MLFKDCSDVRELNMEKLKLNKFSKYDDPDELLK